MLSQGEGSMVNIASGGVLSGMNDFRSGKLFACR